MPKRSIYYPKGKPISWPRVKENYILRALGYEECPVSTPKHLLCELQLSSLVWVFKDGLSSANSSGTIVYYCTTSLSSRKGRQKMGLGKE
jgi:hypothetical protein